MRALAVLVAATLLSACAIQPAEMRLPASLDPGERVSFSGFSGWTHGRFTAGEYSGGYERGLDRLAIADLFRSSRGHAEFTLAGPGISSTIEGRCRVRDRELTLGGAEFDPAPMAYRCDLTAEGRAFPARFELQESRRGLDALTRNGRVGEIAIAGEVVQFHSVHDVAGSPLPVEDPIGYVFEQGGRPIGALELNGRPVLILPAATSIDRRRAMMVASTALATIWDPEMVD